MEPSLLAHTPATALQDEQPSNVDPGYLAALPNPRAMLAALQQAHKAKLAMLAGSGPARQLGLKLSSLTSCDSLRGWRRTWVHQVAFSPDGHYLALSLHCSERVSDPDYTADPYASRPSLTSVMVLKPGTGYTEQACICGSSGTAGVVRFQWAPHAPQLTIVHAAKAGIEDGSDVRSSVLVLDAATGSILHALSPESQRLFQQIYEQAGWGSKLEFSASGAMLLITSCCWGYNDADDYAGWGSVAVFNVCHGKLMVQSKFSMTLSGHEMKRQHGDLAVAAWHPSSRGLVLSHCVILQHPDEFILAGLVLGHLPQPCHVTCREGMGFSPDNTRLVACVLGEDPDLSGNQDLPAYDAAVFRTTHNILRCTLTGPHMSFQSEHVHVHESRGCHWLPCRSRLLFGRSPARLVDLNAPQQAAELVNLGLGLALHSSPSQQLAVHSAEGFTS